MRSSKLVNKAFNGFLLASVLTVLGSQAGALIDALMLSHYIGADAMAGVNVTKPVAQFLFAVTCIIGQGGAMLTGMAIGNQDRGTANRIFSTSMTLLVALGVMAMFVPVTVGRELTQLLCSDVALQGHTMEYLNVLFYGAVPFMLMIALMSYVSVDGAPRLVTRATIISEITHVSVGFVFIRFFGWGVQGAAWATNISYVIAVLIMCTHFRKPVALQYRLGDCDWKRLVAILGMGLPIGVNTSLIAVRMLGCNNAAMTYMGTEGMEVMAVCSSLLGLSMIIISGTISSFNPVATVLRGAQDNRGVMMVARHAFAFMAVALGAYVAFMVTCPGAVASIFGLHGDKLQDMARTGIAVHALNIGMQGFALLIPVYQIYKNKTLAMVVSVGQPILPMLCFWFMCAHPVGISPWWGFFIGQALVLLILVPVALYKSLKDKSLTFPFLIPRKSADHLFDVTVPASIDALDGIMKETQDFLTGECGIGKKDAVAVTLALDELSHNAIQHGSASCVDIRVSVTGLQVRAMIHDDGAPFNPTLKVDQEKNGNGLGLEIVNGLISDIHYSYTFNQNVVSYTIIYTQD